MSRRNRHNKLAEKKTDGSGTSAGVLSSLFTAMMYDMGISQGRWDQLMIQYISDARNSIKQNKKDRASARGNLTKELMKKGMSWRVFMKAMVFLGLRKFDIIIVATHGNGKVTQHMKTVNLGSMVPYPTEESSQDDDIRNGDNDNTLV